VALWAVLFVGCGRSKEPIGDEQGPVTYGNIKAIRLAAPRTNEEAEYLGVAAEGSGIALTDVGTAVLLVQLFDMYCMNCQGLAPDVNRLYQLVLDSDLKDRVRFIGIGKGNTETEVDIFRERYQVPFPLFGDPDKVNTKRLGESRTPYFIIVDMNEKTVLHQQWMLPPLEEMLEKMRSIAGRGRRPA